MPIRKTILITLSAVVLTTLSFYLFQQTKGVLLGAKLTISAPKDGATTHGPLTGITGTAENISELTINDKVVATDRSGNFESTLLLAPGYNIIEVSAVGRFGEATRRIIHLVRQ